MSENNVCPYCGGRKAIIYSKYVKEVIKCLDCGHIFSLKIRCPKCGEMITVDADLWFINEGVIISG